MRCHHRLPFHALALSTISLLPIAHAAGTRQPQRTSGGVVERIRIDAHGRASGVILRDHTEIVTPRAHSDTVMENVRVGDTVRVVTNGGVARLVLARFGRTIPIDTQSGTTREPSANASRPARGGGPDESSVRATRARFDDARPLPDLTVNGRVAFFTHSLTGERTGFVMTDGAQVHVIPRVISVLNSISAGDELQVSGRGIHGAYAPALWAVSIKWPDARGMLLDLSRGPGAPELAYGR